MWIQTRHCLTWVAFYLETAFQISGNGLLFRHGRMKDPSRIKWEGVPLPNWGGGKFSFFFRAAHIIDFFVQAKIHQDRTI